MHIQLPVESDSTLAKQNIEVCQKANDQAIRLSEPWYQNKLISCTSFLRDTQPISTQQRLILLYVCEVRELKSTQIKVVYMMYLYIEHLKRYNV